MLWVFIPLCSFSHYQDIANFKRLIAEHPLAWRSIPPNIRHYIAQAITENPTGEEPYRIGLKEQMAEVANYKEYLDPQSYVAHQAFWNKLNKVFCSMQLNQLEERLSVTNNKYFKSLPTLQKQNADRLRKMLVTTDKPSSDRTSIAPSRPASPEGPTRIDQPARNAQATITKLLRAAAKNICSLLETGKKLQAKQKIIMIACVSLQIPKFWDAVLLDRVDVVLTPAFASSFYYALNAIIRQNTSELANRQHGRTYCLKRAMRKYDDCRHTDLVKQIATTPILKLIEQNRKDQAVLLTIRLIQKVANGIQKNPPANVAKIQPFLFDEEDPGVKHGGDFKASARPKKSSTKLVLGEHLPQTARKSLPPKTPRKHKKILMLGDIGQAPLEKFVAQ